MGKRSRLRSQSGTASPHTARDWSKTFGKHDGHRAMDAMTRKIRMVLLFQVRAVSELSKYGIGQPGSVDFLAKRVQQPAIAKSDCGVRA
jgi:hypothetical protein